jgi:2'-5' RNA ligase
VNLPSDIPARLFVGLWPADDVRQAIEEHAAAWQWPARAVRTRSERLHLTLHFLGQRPAGELPLLRRVLDVGWEGCELELDRCTVWPGGIAVLESSAVPPALARLHADLASRLAAAGVPLDARPYRPHVTLARKAAGARPPPQCASLRWRAAPAYALVQSLPGGGGYRTLQCFG